MADENFEVFRGHTAAQLRVLIQSGGWPVALLHEALEWLNEHELRESARNSASQSEQMEIARSAKDAAWAAARAAEKANTRATAALLIALMSVAATVIGLWVVHRDTVRSVSAAPPAVVRQQSQ